MTDRQKQRTSHAGEPVVGRDIAPHERPGVPMEHEPRPLTPSVRWNEPERMQPVPWVTKRVELDRLTPVYSTALPPRGLSGAIRRIAYNIPESQARHWATILLADRVDSLGIACRDDANWQSMHPDLVFFHDAEVVASILDPHGHHIDDALVNPGGLRIRRNVRLGVPWHRGARQGLRSNEGPRHEDRCRA